MRRYVVVTLLSLAGSAAMAVVPSPKGGRLVRAVIPIPQVSKPIVTGDTVAARYVNTLLFLKEPCPLKIEGARYMHRAWMALGAYQVGCWYPTQDGDYVVIDGTGNQYDENVYWMAQPTALLHPDGSVTIIEKSYNSNTFSGKVSMWMFKQSQKHLQEKP
jgi:hypothetical protein